MKNQTFIHCIRCLKTQVTSAHHREFLTLGAADTPFWRSILPVISLVQQSTTGSVRSGNTTALCHDNWTQMGRLSQGHNCHIFQDSLSTLKLMISSQDYDSLAGVQLT